MNILVLDFERWDSGITDYAFASVSALSHRNHNIIFGGLRNMPPLENARKDGLKTADFPGSSSIGRLLDAIRENRIEILNPHDGKSHFLSFLAHMFTGGKIKIVRTYADARPIKKHGMLWKYTDFFIAAAEFIRRDFISKGVPENRVKVIYRGIKDETIPGLSPKTGKTPGPFRVTIIGRLDPVKGHEIFIKAAALVSKKFPNTVFSVVGAEKNIKIDELKKFADEAGLKNVEFKGYVKDVAAEIEKSDVGVLASIGSEAVSRVALEWFAAGKPVVAAGSGCLPEIIEDGKTGLIVPPGDYEGLAFAITRLLSDGNYRKDISERAKRRAAEMFSWEKFSDEMEEVFGNL